MKSNSEDKTKIGLPPRPFLYTVDQLSVLLDLPEAYLHRQYIYHEGRDIGLIEKHHMRARNIAPPSEKPDWRVAEKEFIRWMRRRGYKYYDRGVITG